MSWNANNRAHACLWIFETWHHNQKDLGFDEVGSWKCDFIIKSAAGESAAMKREKANTHAVLLDDVFTSLYRAAYEANKDQASSIADMEAVLGDSTKTMSDLADVVDAAYRFRGELQ